MTDESAYEVAIVGAGAAGLAAAAVLGRSKRRVAVIGQGDRGNSAATEIHNLPYAEGVAPQQLYATMEREVTQHGIDILAEQAKAVHINDETKAVYVRTAQRTVTASRLLLANGVTQEVPPWVPPGSWGRSVFECPFCHAAEHDGEDFVIVGNSPMTVEIGLLCAPQARSLNVIVTDPDAADGKVADRVRQLGGDVVVDAVQHASMEASGELSLTTESERTFTAGAVLLFGVTRMQPQLSNQLGLRSNKFGMPEVDDEGRASHPQVWVAGTAAKPYYVLAEAIGSGVRAAIGIHKALTLDDLH